MLDPRAFLINSKTGRVVAATFIEFLSGNSTNPSICFTDSPDSGLQCDNAGAVNYVKNGTNLGELVTAASSLVGGSNTQIQFNNSGSFGGSANLTWNNTSKKLGVGGKLEVVGDIAPDAIAAHIKAGNGLNTVGLVVDSDAEDSDILIKARSNTSATPTDADIKFIVTGPGKVGINTPSPGGALEIDAAAATSPFIAKINTSEAFRIDSSGRLLVGTSSTPPAVEAIVPQIVSSSADQVDRSADVGIYNFQNASGIGRIRVGPKLFFGNSRSETNGAVGGAVVNSDHVGNIRFAGDDGAKFLTAAEITGEVDGIPGIDDMPGRLVFSTTSNGASSPTERMRIDSNGKVSTYALSGAGSIGLLIGQGSAAGTTTFLIAGTYGATDIQTGTLSFLVASNGNVTNTNNSYGAISDIKLKENIVDANSQWDDLKALQVRNYNFKEGQTHTQIGLIAQEAELVSPGLISEFPDRDEEGNDLGTVTKSVNYSVLYMKAVKALQEAMERIEVLEQRLTDAGIA